MKNNLNFTSCWDAISQKLLVCKDDPSIDVDWLKTLTRNQLATEITIENDFHSDLCKLIHSTILKGNFHAHDRYRIFQVDHIDSQIKLQPYFVSIHDFDQKSFEDLVLCNKLLDIVISIQETIAESFYEYNIPFDYNQMVQSTKDWFGPLEDEITKKIEKYMSA